MSGTRPEWLDQKPDQWPPAARTMMTILYRAATRRREAETQGSEAEGPRAVHPHARNAPENTPED